MNWQADRMRVGMTEQLNEMFPSGGEVELLVTGFVFRPASDDDVEDDDTEPDPDECLYCFEAHFLAQNHPMVGNLNSTVLVDFPGCDYEEAVQKLVRDIQAQQAG
jgi:hypothetical protein